MSDSSPNAGGNNNNNNNNNRRSSITQAALTNLFSRGPPFPNANANDTQRRRLSVTTVGLSSGPSANTASFLRRGSVSTNSDSIDENAIEDEEGPPGGSRTAPNTPFARHMSFSNGPPMRGFRQGSSPGNGNPPDSPQVQPGLHHRQHGTQRHSSQSRSISLAPGSFVFGHSPPGRRQSPPSQSTISFFQASKTKSPNASSDNYPAARPDQYGFNWSEQLRSRAESSVTGGRPSFSFPLGTGSNSPPRASIHDRARSISEMPQPPVQAPSVKPKQERPKPDAFQERILKGDFYMD